MPLLSMVRGEARLIDGYPFDFGRGQQYVGAHAGACRGEIVGSRSGGICKGSWWVARFHPGFSRRRPGLGTPLPPWITQHGERTAGSLARGWTAPLTGDVSAVMPVALDFFPAGTRGVASAA